MSRLPMVIAALLASALDAPAAEPKVLTFNVYFDGDKARYERLLDWSLAQQCDIMVFQECTAAFLDVLKARIDPGLTMRESGIGDGYGQVTVSRLPLGEARVIRYPTRMGRRALVTEVRAPDGARIDVVNVHLESLDNRELRERQIAKVAEAEAGRCFLLVGDFNFAPGDPDDAALKGLTKVAIADPDAASYDPLTNALANATAAPEDRPQRIDRACASDRAVTGTAKLQRVQLSDHYPVIMTVQVPPVPQETPP